MVKPVPADKIIRLWDTRLHILKQLSAFVFAALLVPLLPPDRPASAAELPQAIRDKDFHSFDDRKAALGRLLFYDPILSGNRNISCGTCHNHDLASADGLSLGVGEGGKGLGPLRTTGSGRERISRRVPRNAPALFNLGAREFTVLFHDGRVAVDDIYGNGFNTPAEEWLPNGLTTVLAAQAMFPLTSEVEMAGDPEENEIAGASNDRIDAVWPIVASRVRAIPAYVEMFKTAFDDVDGLPDITMVHIANAIADFINSEWRAFDSPFDRFIAGDTGALDALQKTGLELFFGAAGCSGCHSGKFFTDHGFHALALPQIGPGRTRQFDPYARDRGRINKSNRIEDAYRFRTPSLRNVTETGPYGHNGTYAALDGIIRHHLDPMRALKSWDRTQLVLPKDERFERSDFIIFEDLRETARLARHVDIQTIRLDDREVSALVAFLGALTDRNSLLGRLGKPQSVPSGLSVD